MGVGAISLIRISGVDAIGVAERACGRDFSRVESRRAVRVRILDEMGEDLDDGLLTIFRAPGSFTGEDCVEFAGHGGVLVTREVLARFLACGAVAAGPGEFSQRAFFHGKLDLTQAEGIMDLIGAQSRLAMRAAREQLGGHLGQKTLAARDAVLGVLAHVEAYVDFPEEDIDPEVGGQLCGRLRVVREELRRLLATADQGRVLREGVRTVIYGEPNVGKSSLLNALAGHERAIVSDVAGTTRDTIEEVVNVEGVVLRLIDTAGLRVSGDAIEREGMKRARAQVAQADLALEIHDASKPRVEMEREEEIRTLLILNKIDLGEHEDWAGVDAVRLSCVAGDGFGELAERISRELGMGEAYLGDHLIAVNARHQACLERADGYLGRALSFLEPVAQPELAAIDLRDALDALGEITGRVDTEDLLGVIFSTFCIGK